MIEGAAVSHIPVSGALRLRVSHLTLHMLEGGYALRGVIGPSMKATEDKACASCVKTRIQEHLTRS